MLWAISGQCTRWDDEPEHTWTVLVRDLYHHSEYCLAVWLPASNIDNQSHNTTESIGLSSATRRYQVLCCYRLIRQGFVEWTMSEGISSKGWGNVGSISKLEVDFFFQSAYYIEKRIENSHVPCFASGTDEKNMP